MRVVKQRGWWWLLLACSLVPLARAEKLVLGADPWCPMICVGDAKGPGFMVEAAQQALAKYGYEVEYQNLPWSRAVSWVESGRLDGLLGANQRRENIVVLPEKAYFWSVMGYALHKRKADLKDLDDSSLAGLRWQLIQDYDYAGTTPFGPWLASHPTLVEYNAGDNPLPQMLGKIALGRGDLTTDNLAVLQYNLHGLGMGGQFHTGTVSAPYKTYIGISRKHPQAARIATLLSHEMQQMRQDGRLQKLVLKYGVTAMVF